MEGARKIAAILLLISTGAVVAQLPKPYRLCVDENMASVINNCRLLNKTDSSVNCVIIKDSVDCALKLQRGEADFAAFTAEEGALASKFIDNTVQVTHELRVEEMSSEQYSFQTVAIVRKDYTGGLAGLRGKNYCHPGFRDSQIWTDWVLKYFERTVAKPEVCDATKFVAENELISIKNFFNRTCRPGEWVHNQYVDNKLKRLYSELCSLCDNPNEGCTYNTNTQGDQHAAIRCLTEKGGHVAYVGLQAVRDYFGLRPGSSPSGNKDDYSFLCEDGTTQKLELNPSCAWVRQPWNFVIARNEIAGNLRMQLNTWLASPNAGSWQSTLSNVLLQRKYKLLNMSSSNLTIVDHISKGRKIPMAGSSTTCANQKPIRWCVIQNETSKCEWMAAAALTHGITPEIKCITARSQWECFQQISSGKADFIGIDSNLGYITRYAYDLTTQMYQETLSDGEYQAIAVIDTTKPGSSSINHLRDLRNKKACFPEYGGVAWVSFVDALRKQNILPRACPHGNTVSGFFMSVCAPGANDPTHDPKQANVKANLCSLCRGNCNATVDNRWYGDEGAFQCLKSGDVAFMNGMKLKQMSDAMTDVVRERYNILCADGSKLPLTALSNLDESCPLVRVVGGELIGRRTRTKIESGDFYLALLEMDDWFGLHPHNFERVFQMFGDFDSKSNLIFKTETLGLITSYDRQLDVVRDYADLKGRADQCGAATASSVIIGHVTWMLTAALALYNVKQ